MQRIVSEYLTKKLGKTAATPCFFLKRFQKNVDTLVSRKIKISFDFSLSDNLKYRLFKNEIVMTLAYFGKQCCQLSVISSAEGIR